MTAKAFLKKYPETKNRFSNLEDIACPKCGQRDFFEITFDVNDREHTVESHLPCRCQRCGYSAPHRKFEVKGLDEALYDRDGKWVE